MESSPVKTFSSLKPSTFHILTVLSDDAVARYLLTEYVREMMEEPCHMERERERERERESKKHITCLRERVDI